MKISIVTPAGAARRSGNQHTAQRWAGFLRALRHRVTIMQDWDGASTDVLIALHARKSSASIERFHAAHPHRPLIVVLTGTDLYRDIATYAEARQALALASRLVVLQPAGLQHLARHLRAKTRVIYQSAATRTRHQPVQGRFRIAVAGHLREEKDPFRTVMALARLPDDDNFEVIQLGDALSADMARTARQWMKREPRYRWLGSKPHADALRRMAGCQLMVVSSVMEGGANVICEASRIGVPILASRVSGNLGMLGTKYPGYFRLFDDRELARLIVRAAADAGYYLKLKNAVKVRAPLFAPAAERRSLSLLLKEMR